MKTYVTPLQITGLSTGWNTVDLDNVDTSLPSDITGCAVLFQSNTTIDRDIGLRKTGDTGNTGNLQYDTCTTLYSEIDGSNQVDVYIEFTDVNAYLIVSFSDEVTWIAEGSQINTTVGTASTWEDWDVSSVIPSTAKWVIGYTKASSVLFSAYVRPDGSSTNLTANNDLEYRGFMVPAKSSQNIEIYSDTTSNATFYVIGYVNDGASSTEKTNAVNLTGEGSAGTFGTLDQSGETLPLGAAVAIMQPYISSGLQQLWIRGNGGTQSLYSDHDQNGTAGLWTVPLGTSDDIEATAETPASVDFYLWGWFGAPVIKEPPAMSVGVNMQAPTFTPVQKFPPALSVGVTLQAPEVTKIFYPPALSVGVTVQTPAALASMTAPDALSVGVVVQGVGYSWTGAGTPFYRAYLTGAADALSDLLLPITGFVATLNDGEATYVQITVPDSYAYTSDIELRPNGQIVVYYGLRDADGNESLRQIARADFEQLSDDRSGEGAATVSLSGWETVTNAGPKTVEMGPPTYRHAGGATRFRFAAVDHNLRPGDTANIASLGESITVGSIYLQVNQNEERMEITEAT